MFSEPVLMFFGGGQSPVWKTPRIVSLPPKYSFADDTARSEGVASRAPSAPPLARLLARGEFATALLRANPAGIGLFLASVRTYSSLTSPALTGGATTMGMPEGEQQEFPPQLGPFRLLRMIGEGGMGRVFEAVDEEMGQRVALKTLRQPSPNLLRLLKTEFRNCARLHHPNLVSLHELHNSGAHWFFTMEFIDGYSFSSYLRTYPDRLREVLRGLARGILALHNGGLLHLDLKPANVLIERSGRVVVLDFGLSSLINEARDLPVSGTPQYMAPEQAGGQGCTSATDWYSFGTILYECLTGNLPYSGSAWDIIDRKKWQEPEPVSPGPDVPEDLRLLCESLLARDPAARPTAATIMEVLELEPPGEQPSVPLLYRERELQELGRSLQGWKEGKCSWILVEGEAGSGRSALVRALLAEHTPPNALLLRAQCSPQQTVPFNAFDELLDQLAAWLSRQLDRIRYFPPELPTVAAAFPVLAEVSGYQDGPRDPAERRRVAFRGLRSLLHRLAAARPLILLVEELDQADEESIALLRALLRPPDPPPFLLLTTLAPDGPASRTLLQVREELRMPSSLHLRLKPLDLAAATALAEHLGMEGSRAAQLAQESGGNPGILVELARHARAVGGGAVGLAPLLDARLAEVSEEARRLLHHVVVADRPESQAVLFQAAGLPSPAAALQSLLIRGLVRCTRLRGDSPLACAHSQVGSLLLQRLPLSERRQAHASLAFVLEARGSEDHEILAFHLEASEQLPAASRHMLLAARRASSTMAFEHAVECYQRALQWDPSCRDATTLEGLAEALADSGRCAKAAPHFLEAAGQVTGLRALELRRRAAEQLLGSGHLEEGAVLVRPLLLQAGIPYPESPFWAGYHSVVKLLWLAVRGTRFVVNETPDPARVLPVDLCWSAARGYLAVDSLKGACFALLSLSRALRLGEPSRVMRALATVGGAVLAPVTPLSSWGHRMVEQSRKYAEISGDPYLRGIVSVIEGQMAVFDGDWERARERCEAGEMLLERHGRGASWERNIGWMGRLRALEELGRIQELDAVAQENLQLARSREDTWAEVTAGLYAAIARLSLGDPEGARRLLEDATLRWTPSGFHVQHLYVARVKVLLALYEGNPAWEEVAAMWPALRRSGLLNVPVVRIDAYCLRARAALASRRPREARAAAASLALEKRLDARAYGALYRGLLQGEKPLLLEAAAGFEQCGMRRPAACARLRAGEPNTDPALLRWAMVEAPQG